MKVHVRFEGGQQLAKTFDQLSTRMSRKIQRDALMEGAEPIRKSASVYAPRAPGAPDIADNIGITAIHARQDVTVAVGPTTGFFYGLFQEFGTTRHGAQPFMRPAFDTEAQRSLAAIGGAMWRSLISRGFATARAGSGFNVSDSIINDETIVGGPSGTLL